MPVGESSLAVSLVLKLWGHETYSVSNESFTSVKSHETLTLYNIFNCNCAFFLGGATESIFRR
jgi:hypothetical protein